MGVLSDWMIERDVRITPFSPNMTRKGVISYGVSSYGYDVRMGYKFKVFSNVHCGVVDPKGMDPKAFIEVDLTPEGHLWESEQCTRCGAWAGTPSQDRSCSTKPNFILIPPNSFALGESLERFLVPRDVLCICLGKSTYARSGIIVNVTPGEPEWEGHWTIEVSNTTPLPAKVYCGEGIMQCVFIRRDCSDAVLLALRWLTDPAFAETLSRECLVECLTAGVSGCKVSYADKRGKYQGQVGLTLPKVD